MVKTVVLVSILAVSRQFTATASIYAVRTC